MSYELKAKVLLAAAEQSRAEAVIISGMVTAAVVVNRPEVSLVDINTQHLKISELLEHSRKCLEEAADLADVQVRKMRP